MYVGRRTAVSAAAMPAFGLGGSRWRAGRLSSGVSDGAPNDRLNVARGFGCSDTTPESASRFGRSCSATFRGQTLIGQLGG
eukprot:1582317-Prymnesium_polylepis.1